jgi:hypothetical protein
LLCESAALLRRKLEVKALARSTELVHYPVAFPPPGMPTQINKQH